MKKAWTLVDVFCVLTCVAIIGWLFVLSLRGNPASGQRIPPERSATIYYRPNPTPVPHFECEFARFRNDVRDALGELMICCEYFRDGGSQPVNCVRR